MVLLFVYLIIVYLVFFRSTSTAARRLRQQEQKKLSFEKPAIPPPPPSPIDTLYRQFGPSEQVLSEMNRAYRLQKTPLTTDQILDRLEVQLATQRYLPMEIQFQELHPENMQDEQLIRYYNLMMQYSIITGATEQAVDIFTHFQPYAESNLLNFPAFLLTYLDNAASICALVGDFEEANNYCTAMDHFVAQYSISDIRIFQPRLTKLKVLFLQREVASAEKEIRALKNDIQVFRYFQYPWQQQYLLNEVERTRLFFPDSDEELHDIQARLQ